ncbi:MAG: Rrf2 family transcriptional regulator [Chloroflexota bacterium]|nr:MAG: Rrf2 family transcriptional regulator [Chloroflexota bacterium]
MRIELSHRGDYAVRAALALAILDDGRPVPARELAARMDIPQAFLAHVLRDLVRAGIAIGTTGRSGGYRLAVPASQVSLLRIVDASEDRGTLPRCVIRGGACRASARCAVHIAFDTANVAMRRELAAATLADLARNEMADGMGRIAIAGRSTLAIE